MSSSSPSDVGAYIARQPPAARVVLKKVRGIVRRALPAAEETIRYGMPAYRLKGRPVAYFAGWKAHWSLYPVSEAIRRELGAALAPYAFSRGTLRFPWAAPVPAELVKRIVEALAIAAERRG